MEGQDERGAVGKSGLSAKGRAEYEPTPVHKPQMRVGRSCRGRSRTRRRARPRVSHSSFVAVAAVTVTPLGWRGRKLQRRQRRSPYTADQSSRTNTNNATMILATRVTIAVRSSYDYTHTIFVLRTVGLCNLVIGDGWVSHSSTERTHTRACGETHLPR